jgi:predicted outer membrane lipoprotein
MFNRHSNVETFCTDQVVGDILSSWRYDISGLSTEMRTDYELHLAECSHCRTRQQLHRNVDVFLITLTTLSVLAFVLAIAVIRHEETLRSLSLALQVHQLTLVLSLETTAILGLLLSMFAWILVAVATPAPGYLNGMLHQHQESREQQKHAA